MKEITAFVIASLIATVVIYNINLSDNQLQTAIPDAKIDYFTKYGA
jgi:hypothetical protein